MPSRAAVSRPGRSAFRDWLKGYRQGESLTHLTASGNRRHYVYWLGDYPSQEASFSYMRGGSTEGVCMSSDSTSSQYMPGGYDTQNAKLSVSSSKARSMRLTSSFTIPKNATLWTLFRQMALMSILTTLKMRTGKAAGLILVTSNTRSN